MELENKLLKREVSSLNDELGTVLERVREAEEGVALHREEAESLREQATTSGRVIRQLRSHDEDMQATLEARDSQIQVSTCTPCLPTFLPPYLPTFLPPYLPTFLPPYLPTSPPSLVMSVGSVLYIV